MYMNILLVEDNINISKLIKKGLSYKKYEIETAYDGRVGLQKALSFVYDLIILDVMLPELNGIEVCRLIREKNKEIPILILSARSTQDYYESAKEAGANAYMIKPFLFEDFYKQIDNLAGNKKKSFKKNFLNDASEKQMKLDFKNPKEDDNHEKDSDKIKNKILDNAPMSIITIDKKGNITSANKYFFNFSTTKNYAGRNIFKSQFFIREGLVDDYKKLLSEGAPVNRENCYVKNSKGEDKYLKIIAVPLRDDNGNIEGALSMAQDNTEAVLYKNELEKYNVELEEMVNDRTAKLDKVNKDLEIALESKSRFMSDISHEMGTSLSIIQGHLELFSIISNLKSDSKESYEQIKHEAKRLSEMLRDLNMLSKSNALEDEFKMKIIDLKKIINNMLKSLSPLANEKNVKLNFDAHGGKAEISADEQKIEMLFLNLIKNAIKYNNEGGSITVTIKRVDKGFEVNIEDTGIGIGKEHQSKIFERFYRVDESRARENGGYGLGLAICKWVADKHAGSIKLKSIPGKGSTFSVYLPK